MSALARSPRDRRRLRGRPGGDPHGAREGARGRRLRPCADQLGAAKLVTNASSEIVWRADYAAFGEARLAAGSSVSFNLNGGGTLLLATTALADAHLAATAIWVLGVGYGLAVPASLYYMWVQWQLRRVCRLCMVAHGVNLSCAAVFAWHCVRDGMSVPPMSLLMPVSLLLFVFGLVVVSAVAPFLHTVEQGAALKMLYRRVVEQPLGALAVLESEPPVEWAPVQCGVAFGEPGAQVEVAVFVSPACAPCATVLAQLERLLESSPGQMRAVVCAVPLSDAPGELALCSILGAVGLSTNARRFFDVLRTAKQRFADLIELDSVSALGNMLEIDGALPAGALERAQQRVLFAKAENRRLDDGNVPSVFINRKRMRLPLSHLETWMADPRMRALLAPSVAVRAAELDPEQP